MTSSSSEASVLSFPKAASKKASSTERIWGKAVYSHGYAGIPSLLIQGQRRLGMNSTQMNIVIQLLDYWHEPTRKPFPTKRDLAKRIGVTEKTIQNNIRAMENAGLICREMRKTAAGDWNSNIYHLDGLVAKVQGALLGEWQPGQLEKAIENVRQDGKEPTPGRIVAALTFGFWTAMFGKDYEVLWQTTLHRIARRPDGKGLRRKDFSGPLTPIRTLRNRIAHHEPILTWNLPKHHDKIIELTSWLSPPASEWCIENSRFPELHPAERILLHIAERVEISATD